MIECRVDHPGLPGLFEPHLPNNPALWAVFQGRHAGRALVDSLPEPSQCVVRTDALLTYASKSVSAGFLAEAIRQGWQSERVWLVRSAGDPPAPQGYQVVPRLEFYGYDAQSPVLSTFREHLAAGFEMRLIDEELIQRCEWRDDMAFYCGSIENFLRNDFGMCLMRGDEIIVEAYASAFGSPYAEIGAVTHAAYRGLGYAPIAVAHLIENLEQRGYHAYWSCDVVNPASAHLARKLGFKVERPYEIWDYPPG